MGANTVNDTAIDTGANEADDDELGEFRFLTIAGNILECPVFVHEITVDDGDEEGDGIEYEDAWTTGDACYLQLDIEYRKIDDCIDATDDDENRKLFDNPQEAFSGEIHE
jgi:hypothetical protein